METNSACPDSTCRYRNSLGYCTSSGACIMVTKKVKIEEKGLTISGYDGIIDRIINRTVQPPNDKRCFELNAWLQGYADCQNAILEIIGQLKDQYGR